MQALAIALGAVAFAVAAVGCVVPVLPGPIVAYAALWALYAFGCPPPMSTLAVCTAVVVFVTVVDYVLPSVFAKKFKCSGWGVFGCFAGSVVGLFFMPIGIVAGPFFGTVAGELIAGRGLAASLRGGIGSLLGFVLCLVLKLCSVAYFAWEYFACMPVVRGVADFGIISA